MKFTETPPLYPKHSHKNLLQNRFQVGFPEMRKALCVCLDAFKASNLHFGEVRKTLPSLLVL